MPKAGRGTDSASTHVLPSRRLDHVPWGQTLPRSGSIRGSVHRKMASVLLRAVYRLLFKGG